MISWKNIQKYFFLLFLYFIWPTLTFLWIAPPYNNSVIFMLTITGVVFCIYVYFDFRSQREEFDFELLIFLKVFSSDLKDYEKEILRLDIDLFVSALALIFPNLFFVGILLLDNFGMYLISIIPAGFLISIALVFIYKNYQASQKILRRLQTGVYQELSLENEIFSLQKYSLLKNFDIIIFPKVKVLFLIIGFIASFVMPFLPM